MRSCHVLFKNVSFVMQTEFVQVCHSSVPRSTPWSNVAVCCYIFIKWSCFTMHQLCAQIGLWAVGCVWVCLSLMGYSACIQTPWSGSFVWEANQVALFWQLLFGVLGHQSEPRQKRDLCATVAQHQACAEVRLSFFFFFFLIAASTFQLSIPEHNRTA